ncbi:hypothetical protein RQP46_002067 [Phenoliferia psychrophenolica]
MVSALAWSNEDHEIFDIVSALETAEGKGTNFYSFLNVTKGATEKDISKSYRKRSLELHPDKNPDDKVIADRFARLGTIAGILRDAEKRARYDHFYENGVPRWRGTGYYYSRYRPGLGTVLVALTFFSCFIQYVYFMLKWGLDVTRVRAFQQQALEYAWGPTKKPLAGRKRLKLKTGDQVSPAIPGINRGRPTKPGHVMEMVVEGEKVFIVEQGEESLITEDNIVFPSMRETWIPTMAYTTYARATGRPLPSSTASGTDNSDEEEDTTPEQFRSPAQKRKAAEAKEKAAIQAAKKPKGPARGTEGAGKVGGRRRAGVPKKVVET